MSHTPEPTDISRAIRELGKSAGHASDVANKNTPPSLKLAFQLKRKLGLPVDHWEDVAMKGDGAA
jgi:hypothetical protein